MLYLIKQSKKYRNWLSVEVPLSSPTVYGIDYKNCGWRTCWHKFIRWRQYCKNDLTSSININFSMHNLLVLAWLPFSSADWTLTDRTLQLEHNSSVYLNHPNTAVISWLICVYTPCEVLYNVIIKLRSVAIYRFCSYR